MFIRSFWVSVVGLLIFAVNVQAGTPGLEGVVKDPAKHPIKDADVRIEGKNFSKTVKTDASGHYASGNLAVGNYKVTLLVNGAVKASILNSRVLAGHPTRLNFDLTAKTGSAKTHMVYVPTETGTHIGSGQWVEVDEHGNPVNRKGQTSSVDTYSGTAFDPRQSNQVPTHPIGH